MIFNLLRRPKPVAPSKEDFHVALDSAWKACLDIRYLTSLPQTRMDDPAVGAKIRAAYYRVKTASDMMEAVVQNTGGEPHDMAANRTG